MFNNYAITELQRMVGKNEKIFWQGKPDKRCYILEGIFNPLLPFALIWFLFDAGILFAMFSSNAPKETGLVAIPFFLVHLMPVWIYLAGVLLIQRRYKHVEYIVTDKGVYYSGGLFAYTCNMKPFTELARVNVKRGIIDQMLGVGDVYMTSSNVGDLISSNVMVTGRPINAAMGITIEDIRDYMKVFELIKKLQEDIYTDTMYPNDLRPESNHGYRTQYRDLDI